MWFYYRYSSQLSRHKVHRLSNNRGWLGFVTIYNYHRRIEPRLLLIFHRLTADPSVRSTQLNLSHRLDPDIFPRNGEHNLF
jgi:hypothetical protein